jgi:hypothetical protein
MRELAKSLFRRSKMGNDHLVIITDVEKFKKCHPDLKVEPFAKQGCFYCMVCGQHFNYETPISIDLVLELHNAFIRAHSKCKVTWKKTKKLLRTVDEY